MLYKLAIIAGLLLLANPAGAQSVNIDLGDALQVDVNEDTGRVKVRAPGVNIEARENRMEARQERQEEAREIRIDARDNRIEVRDGAQQVRIEARADAKARIETKRGEFQEKRSMLRIESKEMREGKMAEAKEMRETKRAELKAKLGIVKDERKQKSVLKIEESIAKLNTNITTRLTELLNKVDDVLVKLSTRADEREVAGVDVSVVRSAIVSAESSIAAVRTSIENQIGQVYTLTVSTEANLRADVGETRKALHADLQGLKAEMKSAHESVRAVAKALKDLPRPTVETSIDANATAETE